MLRRPSGEGRNVVRRKKLWALAAIFLPLLTLVDADLNVQQRAEQQSLPLASPLLPGDPDRNGPAKPRHQSPLEGGRVIRNLAATALTGDLIDDSYKKRSAYVPNASPKSVKGHGNSNSQNHQTDIDLYNNIVVSHDASAISATAPDLSVRAPSARKLADWEVEDFVLLATIDGDLYATERKSGKVRWKTSLGQPMVETKHYRTNKSAVDAAYGPWDQNIWAVEPTRDGGIYMWGPGQENGLTFTGLTMKKLVENMSPYENRPASLIYTGDKKTTLLTLDTATGHAIKFFGPNAFAAEEYNSCPRPQDPVVGLDAEECNTGSITLGRTEYTVRISSTRGYPIATLKYSEWSPNVFDHDLLRQYDTTKDNLYITSHHDGRVYSFQYDRGAERKNYYDHFPTPIARVFDVIRPARDVREEDGNPQLVALPQPPPPPKDEHEETSRSNSIFLNETSGNWYAMSARAYPLITDAPAARINRLGWWEVEELDRTDPTQLSQALAGQHFLGDSWPKVPTLPGSSDSVSSKADTPRRDSDVPTLAIDSPNPTSTVIERVKRLPQDAANSVVELLTNPLIGLLLMVALIYYRNDIIRRVRATPKQSVRWAKGVLKQRGFNIELDAEESSDETCEPRVVENGQRPERTGTDETAPAREALNLEDELAAHQTTLTPEVVVPTQPVAEAEGEVTPVEAAETPPEKKKKAHRGRRGGKNHRKKKNSESDSADDVPLNSVEEAVNNAKKLGERTQGPEPDIQTLPYGVEEVSNPILRIDESLEVNEDQQLGTGSNGTVVFAGKWQDRPVAVKRMLRDFYDIASQETRLLREVDRHQNVIQYFAQLERGNFIYIALELCEASLADVMEKPSQFRQLANAGAKDTLAVLKQITKGLDHLHSLQIVHRDLKPQNILITMDRKTGRPRILVSDFGLCKKLEGGQSSFGATTAHAAGTSGWRAPELLLDDDTPATSGGPILLDAQSSTHSGNDNGSSSLQSPENRHRRVTRSIDIFSLGVVFFYVLTQGSHPFDCGDRYMREVNIRKNTYSLARLDILGDYKCEAKHLIEMMISANPKERPKTKEILAHPFFWDARTRLLFLCDVSDAFEREPRDPPSPELQRLEEGAPKVTKGDFLSRLHKDFVDSLGRQRKYTGGKLLDLLRALRNKRNHYLDMPDALQKKVGSLPEGYLLYWTTRFPDLLLYCWSVIRELGWNELEQFSGYYQAPESG